MHLQCADDAKTFYESKVGGLAKTLQEVEGVLQQKTGNIRAIDDGMLQYLVFTSLLNPLSNCTTVIRKKVTTATPQEG